MGSYTIHAYRKGLEMKAIIILSITGIVSSLLANETRQSALDVIRVDYSGVWGIGTFDQYMVMHSVLTVIATTAFVSAVGLIALRNLRVSDEINDSLVKAKK